MSELKALRTVLVAQIGHLRVTHLDVDGHDGLFVDEVILNAAGVLNAEKVDIAIHESGARLALHVNAAPSGSGIVRVSGPAASFGEVGNRLTMSVYGVAKEKAARRAKPPALLVVTENNRVPSQWLEARAKEAEKKLAAKKAAKTENAKRDEKAEKEKRVRPL